MYVLEDKSLLLSADRKHEKKHILFLAKDIEGYHQIANSVTRGQMMKDKDVYLASFVFGILCLFIGYQDRFYCSYCFIFSFISGLSYFIHFRIMYER